MVDQSLPLCLLFSVLAGITAVLEYPPLILYERQGKHKTKCKKVVAVLCNIAMQGASLGFVTIAPWYGPVSIYRPTALASKLLSSIVIVGQILKYDTFDKATESGTMLIVLSAIILPIVGPGVQEDQNVKELFLKPHALVWFGGLSLVFFVSLFFMLTTNLRKYKESHPGFVQSILLGVSLSASTLSASVSRAMIAFEGGIFTAFLVYYVVLNVAWMWENVLEATAAPSLAKFLPFFVGGSIMLNAMSGIFLWEDGKVMASWTGYIGVFLQMILGLYLMADCDWFSIERRVDHDSDDSNNNNKNAMMSSRHLTSSLFQDLEVGGDDKDDEVPAFTPHDDTLVDILGESKWAQLLLAVNSERDQEKLKKDASGSSDTQRSLSCSVLDINC